MAKNPQTPAGRAAYTQDEDLLAWIADMQAQKRSKHTIKQYALTLRVFKDWLDQEMHHAVPLRRVSESDLKQYQIWLSTQKGYSKNSLYTTIKALQAFYRFLGLETADTLKPPKRSQSLPKYLTEAEATRLLEAASDTPRSHAMVGLLLYSGLRVGELCSVQIPDIDFDELTLRIRSGKGDKDRLVIVAPKCMGLVKAWLAVRPKSPSDYLFPMKNGKEPLSSRVVQRIVLARAKKAGLEKRVTPHVLRHTLATTLLRRGGDIRFIQRILGHASIATTQIYTHLDDAELKRMYEKSRPEF